MGTHPKLGWMLTPKRGLSPATIAGVAWGADNGCFAHPEAFDLDRYLAWLKGLHSVAPTCLFATAPDVVGDAVATLARSAPALPRIREIGLPAGLVAQDGLESLPVPWDMFDTLFLGGTTHWKLSEAAYELVGEARARGKHVHCGRVNGWTRYKAMALAGCDSADGTTLAFAPDKNLRLILNWFDRLEAQQSIPLWR